MAQSIESMEQRYQMLINRKGKNSENVGIMRKLRRKINKAKSGIILSGYRVCFGSRRPSVRIRPSTDVAQQVERCHFIV